ncbi:MAG: D-glycero-beta-D-manno-heptose 1-phosphate adenylyltransferase [Candidatus Omnitrophica bacterium]|nr:D-glycero-beta-D-manno-heptose 1-phosphate adenylyltransferase [Candidatus Omnitrophota bacterium]
MRTGGRGPFLKSKIKTLAGLKKALLPFKAKGKRIVFTNGCFDLLHYGHAMYLEAARRKGEALVVGLNSDASIRRLKGPGRPVLPERDRARMLAALESVDFVVLFSEDTPIRLIESLKPDVLVKGSDWKKSQIAGSGFVRSYGGRVLTIKLAQGRSTSAIIKKIAALNR